MQGQIIPWELMLPGESLLPGACFKDLLLRLKRNRCTVFNQPAPVLLKVKHEGSGLSLLGCN